MGARDMGDNHSPRRDHMTTFENLAGFFDKYLVDRDELGASTDSQTEHNVSHGADVGVIATMTLSDLTARVRHDVEGEEQLCAILVRAGELAKASNAHALALLLNVLADTPVEVATRWLPNLDDLAHKSHPDTDQKPIARVAFNALKWFVCDGCGELSTHVVADPTAEGRSVKPGAWCDTCDPGYEAT